jgi:hypothetical protein
MSVVKPIKVFWNELGQRFYASRAYVETKPGVWLFTGQKFDVTDDIAHETIKHGITFTKLEEGEKI